MSQQTLSQYLKRFARRQRIRQRNDGLAIVAAVALGFSLLAALWLIRHGFPKDQVGLLRITGAGVLVALGYFFLWRPLRRKTSDQRRAQELETRAPFDGRLNTWAGTAPNNPLRPLLAEDALGIAQSHPPEQLLPRGRLNWPAAAASICTLALAALLIAGPGLWGYGLRHLWAGWLIPDLLPPQSLVVTPGDTLVRRGGRLIVNASARGFAPGAAEVFARRGDGQWQSTSMRLSASTGADDETEPTADDAQAASAEFGFTFPAVRQPLEYYVQAGEVRSPTYTAEVIALPRITDFAMTYTYPQWTRREPREVRPGGDIRAIAGTEVALAVTTDSPLPGAAIVVAGASTAMTLEANVASGTLTVREDDRYYLAAVVGGDEVRLTDDFLIRALEDQAPALSFATPARDVDAHAIEEVALTVRAEDDFGLNNITLHVAVNGGEFIAKPLLAEGVVPDGQSSADEPPAADLRLDHLLMLEDLAGQGYLMPGDVVSYYASATDRESDAESDLFFISIKPFDRRISQSQASGGQQSGGPQDEISQRQREIILSTWNLRKKRRQSDADASAVQESFDDKATLLADLQATLAGQANTLAERARARELGNNGDISRYIGHLDDAVEAMGPAIEQLKLGDFELAMAPEQEALQHLLRAESVFTDIEVTTSANPSGGSGSGSDLAEMMELELDLEKNQYETASQASPEQSGDSVDETLDALEDLARRQQALADGLSGSSAPTPAQRWQQEKLKREVEELLEELQRNGQSSQSAEQQSSQGQSSQNQSNESSSSERSEQSQDLTREELAERLAEAAKAMEQLAQSGAQESGGDSPGDDQSPGQQRGQQPGQQPGQQAGQQPGQRQGQQQGQNRQPGQTGSETFAQGAGGGQGQNNPSGESAAQAANNALAQLRAAADAAAQQQAQSMEDAFGDLAQRAEALLDEQAALAQTLDDALAEAMKNRPSPSLPSDNGRPQSGLTPTQEYDLGRQKRELGKSLQALQQDMLEAARDYEDASLEGSQALREGVADLDRSEAIVRLGMAAEYIEYGAAAYIVSTEDLVTDAMRRLSENAADAQRRASRSAQAGRGAMEEALAELSRLRRDLQTLAQGEPTSGSGQPGQQPGQQPGEQPGNPSGPAGEGQDGAGGQPGQNPDATGGNSSINGRGTGTAAAGATFEPRRVSEALRPLQAQQAINDRADDVADMLDDALPSLAGRKVSEEELRELRALLGDFDLAALSGNPTLLDAELARLLRLTENLEIGVRAAAGAAQRSSVRAEAPRQVSVEYRDAVSDYYRRLSELKAQSGESPP
ncbi:MAG: hypothetical protein AB8B96_17940 [Lysobacterales bacterium]